MKIKVNFFKKWLIDSIKNIYIICPVDIIYQTMFFTSQRKKKNLSQNVFRLPKILMYQN